MSLELTPCGHLKSVQCNKCRPKPASQEQSPAFQEQMEKMTLDIQNLLDQWVNLGYPPQMAIGLLLGTSTGIAQSIGVTKPQYLQHLSEFWPDD